MPVFCHSRRELAYAVALKTSVMPIIRCGIALFGSGMKHTAQFPPGSRLT